MKTIGLVLLFFLPMMVFGQIEKSDTLTLDGLIFIGNHRRQIDSIELIDNSGRAIVFSSDRLGKFRLNNLKLTSYRLNIKEFDYDTTFTLGHDVRKEIWIYLPWTCDVSEEIANLEIHQGRPRLLLIGGIAPSIVVGQEDFEKKFNVRYYDFGCTPPDRKCVTDYNKAVFTHLDKTYGKKWRKKVRTDVIGYSDEK